MNIKENLKQIFGNFIVFTTILTIVGIFNQNAFNLKYFLICLALAVQCKMLFPQKQEKYDNFDEYYETLIKNSHIDFDTFQCYGDILRKTSEEIKNLEYSDSPINIRSDVKRIIKRLFYLDPFLFDKQKNGIIIKQEKKDE